VSKKTGQNSLVGQGIHWSAAEHRPFGPRGNRPKNPPYGAPIRFGLNNWWRELHARSECHLFGQGEIGALKLPGGREYMGGQITQFCIGHIDNDECIE
jgi:hypothetical protein